MLPSNPRGFLADPTRYLFFTGKAASQNLDRLRGPLALADGGKSVLLVSTIRHPTSTRYWTCPWQSTGRSPSAERLHVLQY